MSWLEEEAYSYFFYEYWIESKLGKSSAHAGCLWYSQNKIASFKKIMTGRKKYKLIKSSCCGHWVKEKYPVLYFWLGPCCDLGALYFTDKPIKLIKLHELFNWTNKLFHLCNNRICIRYLPKKGKKRSYNLKKYWLLSNFYRM